MATFGIIGEGITDQIVIENVLRGCLTNDDDEPVVNYVQPLLDRTGKSGAPDPGGWTLVFRYLDRRDHLAALQFNDYLVIHIDTDVCEEPGFDVPRREGGRELTPRELAERVTEKLKSRIGADVVATYGERLLFAVAVHGIECWLLPLFFPNRPAKAGKVTGCLKTANDERRRKDRDRLSNDDGKDKDPRAYHDASKPLADRRRLAPARDACASLAWFVEQVDAARARAAAADGATG